MDPKRFKLPGFGLPLNFLPTLEDIPLDHGLNAPRFQPGAAQLPLTTFREFEMLDIMNKFTDVPNWHFSVFDESYTSNWKAEQLAAKHLYLDVSEKMFDWCIAELRCKAQFFEKTGAVRVYRGDVIKSDSAISESLKNNLKRSVTPLEDVPDRLKDWRLDFDEQVLDLVHPSLFPLLYGQSRILPNDVTTLTDYLVKSGKGIVVPLPGKNEYRRTSRGHRGRVAISRRSQWLPCDVDISGSDGDVRITSYINNVHPTQHADIYRVIEKIISHTIPVWDLALTPLNAGQSKRRITYGTRDYQTSRAIGKFIRPEPGTFVPSREPGDFLDLRTAYGDRGLQIIVQLTNIYLTPENPEYDGDTWHLDGVLNEHICATAMYCYDSSNILQSHIAFRQRSNPGYAERIPCPPDDRGWLFEVFGCEDQEPAVQEVGDVHIREGRLIAWPNILQHVFTPFELTDSTKPGHCKILTLFLVDPNVRVISTANVPCQRKDWWMQAVRGALPLPTELQDLIFENVDDFLMDVDDARMLKAELTEGREALAKIQNEAFCKRRFWYEEPEPESCSTQ